ncbi:MULTISPECIES: hypothetical protein [Aeromicrobium]|uniref:hypothetical protein n=1 Tax=Aeromicrobium TaxID=2040 RepID=UPI0006F30BE1|nr:MULTISPECIES: hypothetical protein [Aeromicrobium]KQX74239.1 hypothetical protein ASD10_03035 [Aeromicrobium sp. Root472D3]MCL8249837.1 hypothetical protein [Aeromicrobium fastidiosum]
MRSSLLTRSAVAVASLAIGSVALAAAPASADTTTGTSREAVLTVADQIRNDNRFADGNLALVEKICGIGVDDGRDIELRTTNQPEGVDGFIAEAFVDPADGPSRTCTFAGFATEKSSSTMSGTATLAEQQFSSSAAAPTSHDYTLSGDVYVTAPVTDLSYGYGIATASGNVTVTQARTTTSSRVVTPKSTERKRAAYKAYNRTIDTAQAKLSKALKKADGSSSKKAAARKAYAARKKAAKATLHRALAGTLTIVVTENANTSTTAFTFTTQDLRLR